MEFGVRRSAVAQKERMFEGYLSSLLYAVRVYESHDQFGTLLRCDVDERTET